MLKKIDCPKCGGGGFITNFSKNTSGCGFAYDRIWNETCMECNGTGVISTFMTNGDRLRNCTNEQLAKVRTNLTKWAIYADDPLRLLLDSEEDFLLWLNKETDDMDEETIFNF